MRIIVVEDDRMISSFVAKGLEQAGFVVDVAEDGIEGFQMLSSGTYDAAVVDIMLPRMEGLSMLSDLRQQGCKTPVIILSAKRSLEDKVRGLDVGGDDYLVKPFAFVELLARIKALLRRSMTKADMTILKGCSVEMNLVKHSVTIEGHPIELPPREFSLLEYLLRNEDNIVSKTMIVENVWDYNFDPQTNVVEASICRLRQKLADVGKNCIKTIRGVGYVLTEEKQHV